MEKPDLILGTGMWAWTVDKKAAFTMLDAYYSAGFRRIDTATNYPIDKNPEHFRAAETILEEWIKTHRVNDLRIICKIGSVNNLFTPEHNLAKSFVLFSSESYLNLFGENAETLMLHWDNRADIKSIHETYEGLQIAKNNGWKLGLSGIKNPAQHAKVNQAFNFDFSIQMKHNPFDSAYGHYTPFHSKNRRFIAYGTTGGGIKLNANYSENSSLHIRNKVNSVQEKKLEAIRKIIVEANSKAERPTIDALFQLGLIHAGLHPTMEGIILGCSSLKQLETSLNFYQKMQEYDYSDVYNHLQAIK